METSRLDQQCEVKALQEDGTFEGLAASYGNVDGQGDVIQPGAFKGVEGETIPLLFAHKTDQPIGTALVSETPAGLFLKGKLLLDTVAGREAYSRLKAGVLRSLSVGFKIPVGGFNLKAGIRHITSAVLKEVSLVLFPANDLALVTSVKAEPDTPQDHCRFNSLLDLL